MRVSSCLVLLELVYICAFLITAASSATPGSFTGISVSRPKASAPEVYRSAKSENLFISNSYTLLHFPFTHTWGIKTRC